MANKKRAAVPVIALELDKTLVVDDVTYNINAVNADQAAKVKNSLTIKSLNLDGQVNASETVSFDGETAVEFSAISATAGGRFGAPIRVPNNQETIINNEAVLNYNDILKIVGQLTGSGWFTWDGSFKSVIKDNTPQRMGVIIGKDADKTSFAETNVIEKYLPLFLYIASDSGKLYFGNSEDTNVTWLSKSAESASTATSLTNERLLQVNLERTVPIAFDGRNDASGTQAGIGVIGTLAETNGGTGKTQLADVEVGCAKNLRYDDTVIITGKELYDTQTIHSNDLNNIKNGTIVVGAAKKAASADNAAYAASSGTAESAKKASSADYATSAGSAAQANNAGYATSAGKANAAETATNATTATKDANGNIISTYYQKKITISSRAPSSSDGSNGDIWIKY